MPDLSVRPARINALGRASNSIVFTLTFPAGYLTGKTWTSAVGATTIAPSIAGDVMTVNVTEAITAALGNGRHGWTLTETTGGISEVRLGGQILLGDAFAESSSNSATITVSSVSVAVTVQSGGASQAALDAEIARALAAEALLAPKASPTFTGTPAAPTAAPGTNTTQLATTAYVVAQIAALIGTAPGVLDTLGEISDAINDDANLYTTLVNALALKANLASPALTGVPTVPTAAANTNTTQAASTAYVQTEIADEVTRADGTYVGSSKTADAVTTEVEHLGASQANSGLRGIALNRSALGKPLGFTLETAGTPEWDVMALDYLTDDLVFVYDHEIPGDQLRYRKGAHLLFGRSVGQPATTYRFRIDAVAADPSGMVDLLVLNGSTAASAGTMTHLFRATNATETTLSVRADGLVGIGVLNPTQRLHVALAQDATTQFLLANSSAGASARVSTRLQGDQRSLFLEVFSSGFTTTSLRNTAAVYANTSADLCLGSGNTADRLRLNAAGTALTFTTEGLNMAFGTATGTKIGTATSQKIGFWNATPVVQPTGIADADGTLADITTKFNSLLAKMETIGLLAAA